MKLDKIMVPNTNTSNIQPQKNGMTDEDVKQGENRRIEMESWYVCANRIGTKANSVKWKQYYMKIHVPSRSRYSQNECRKSMDVKINVSI